jgi:hypothetical protein
MARWAVPLVFAASELYYFALDSLNETGYCEVRLRVLSRQELIEKRKQLAIGN